MEGRVDFSTGETRNTKQNGLAPDPPVKSPVQQCETALVTPD